MDQLVRLREKFAFPDAAMATLQIIAETDFLPLGIMVADLRGHRGDVLELPEIERLAPDERLDGIEEIIAERPVARTDARADEGGLLPCERARFIIADRGLDRQDDGADLGRGAQAHVDAKDIAVGIQRRQQFNDAPPIADRSLGHIIAFAVGQRLRVEQENRVDVGRIVQLPPAMLAQRDDGKTLIRCPGHAFLYGCGDGLVERMVGEIRKDAGDAGQVP